LLALGWVALSLPGDSAILSACFFFLCVALFLFYSGSFSAELTYLLSQPPDAQMSLRLESSLWGCVFCPRCSCICNRNAETRGLLRSKEMESWRCCWFLCSLLHLAVQRIPLLYQDPHFDFLVPEGPWARLRDRARSGPGVERGWEGRLRPGSTSRSAISLMLLSFFACRFCGRRAAPAPDSR